MQIIAPPILATLLAVLLGHAPRGAVGHHASPLTAEDLGPPERMASYVVVDGPGSEAPLRDSAYLGDCTLTSDVEELLRADLLLADDLGPALQRYRQRRPAIYSTTPPPSTPPRMPGEFEPAETLLLAYQPFEVYADVFADIIEVASEHGRVRVLTSPDDRDTLEELVAEGDPRPGTVSIVDDVPFESVWMRDYGPQSVLSDEGLELVDASYFANCPHDDAVPTRISGRWSGARVRRHGLIVEGGNLISNGDGLCLTTSGLPAVNGATEAEVEEVLRAYYGCHQTIFLLPLAGNAVDHVDLIAAFTSSRSVLVGAYTARQDSFNQVILDLDAAALEDVVLPDGGRLQVTRVPMPEHGESVEGGPRSVVRSYLNFTIFNGVVLVPVYGADPEVEARALETIARDLPGRQVVPIASDSLAQDGGAIHCITQTIPRHGRRRATRRGI